ncbi:Glyoxalase-like domain protein [Enhygromyxa salina]|uniref:Glyoxalase-like domain protein n=1 Tax=Enhygromyxa salina TaxID=215803 RepID=A0A2S9YCG2_9BACT|nr:VOC family protein [Enhygromyxa salina]PRQ02783.1 Glyoxalase-like domain protein [Enhygromyxa salina]
MADKQARQIYLNLPVADLERSKAFFTKLGFEFNPQFTDEKAACMVINEGAYVMLLRREFFSTFTKRSLCDTGSHTEAMTAFSCESRARVDEIAEVALANGGRPAMEPTDHGFMYGRGFYDPDGHHWEPMWMDMEAATP